MSDERYMSWFRQVVEMGWACGLYQPQEILANYLLHFYQVSTRDEKLPYKHVERFMIDVTADASILSACCNVTLEAAINHFDSFYADGRVKFGAYIRTGGRYAPSKN